jgi:hypothetical protein
MSPRFSIIVAMLLGRSRASQTPVSVPAKALNSFDRLAKFTYEAWNHPKTLAIISRIAGIDLVPSIDYEVAHVNTSTPAPPSSFHPTSKERIDENALVGWHRDSYPFVCVVMLSDTGSMLGGETAIKTSGGEIRKVRGPAKVRVPDLGGRHYWNEYVLIQETGMWSRTAGSVPRSPGS